MIFRLFKKRGAVKKPGFFTAPFHAKALIFTVLNGHRFFHSLKLTADLLKTESDCFANRLIVTVVLFAKAFFVKDENAVQGDLNALFNGFKL